MRESEIQLIMGAARYAQSEKLPLTDGKWHHIAFTVKENSIEIYFDNQRVVNEIADTDEQFASSFRDHGNQVELLFYEKVFVDEFKLFRHGLEAEHVQSLYDQAPLLNLHLDDTNEPASQAASVTLENAANNGLVATCTGINCPGIGVDGQIGHAVAFNGLTQTVTVADNDLIDLGTDFTLGVWVRPTNLKPNLHPIIAKDDSDLDHTNYALSFQPNSYKLRFEANGSNNNTCAGTPAVIESSGALVPFNWNHVMVVGDTAESQQITLYINGEPNQQVAHPGELCVNDDALVIGSAPSTTNGFEGQLDELVVYKTALSPKEVKVTYERQAAWFNGEVTNGLVIDTDKPTVALDTNSTFLPARDVVMAIKASDPTSSIAKVEYQLPDISSNWETATQDNGIWIFTFDAYDRVRSEGPYTIKVRSTDVVGHVSEEQSYQVIIDNATPTITLDQEGSGIWTANPNGRHWSVTLQGSIADDGFGEFDQYKSGLQNLHIALVDPKGDSAGVAQTLVWTDTRRLSADWTATIPLPAPPNGPYYVQLSARDNVGNGTGAQTSSSLTTTIPISLAVVVDGSPPLADVTYTGALTGVIHSSGTAPSLALPNLQGTVSDLAYPSNALLRYHFEETNGTNVYDGSRNHATATCLDQCPHFNQAGKIGQTLTFTGQHNSLIVNEPINLASQSFSIAFWTKVTEPQAIPSQFIFAQGSPSQSFTDNLLVEFEADKLTCQFSGYSLTTPVTSGNDDWHHWACTFDATSKMGRIYRNGIPLVEKAAPDVYRGQGALYIGRAPHSSFGNYFNGSLDELLVYNRPLTEEEIYNLAHPSGSGIDSLEIAFVPRQDSLLEMYLPFNDASGSQTFVDASSQGNDVTCSSSDTCPNLVNGKTNFGTAASFDGSDDTIPLGDTGDLGLTDSSFTIAAWVNATNLNGFRPIAGNEQTGSRAFSLGVSDSKVSFNLGNNPELLTSDDLGASWQHVIWRYNHTTMKQAIFINGQAKITQTTTFAFTTNDLLSLGKNNNNFFQGSLDDFRLYDYALEDGEIQALATAPNPLGPVWSAIALDQPGQLQSTWSYTVPQGLEGSYSLHLRATDKLGHSKVWPNMWHGLVDTQAPRMVAREATSPNLFTYTVSITDTHLAPHDFQTACGANRYDQIAYFEPDWVKQIANKAHQARVSDNKPTKPQKTPKQASHLYVDCALQIQPDLSARPLDLYNLPGDEAQHTVVSGNYAYVAAGNAGLIILDVSDPEQISFVSSLPSSQIGLVGDVVISGTHVIATAEVSIGTADTARYGLKIIDVQNPKNPTLVSYVKTNGPGPETLVQFKGYVYLLSDSGLEIFDVRQPQNPVFVKVLSNFTGTDGGLTTTASPDQLFVVDFGRIEVYLINDPANPTPIEDDKNPLSGFEDMFDVAVVDPFVYVAGGDRGLIVIQEESLSNPFGRKILTTIPGQNVTGVEYTNGEVYFYDATDFGEPGTIAVKKVFVDGTNTNPPVTTLYAKTFDIAVDATGDVFIANDVLYATSGVIKEENKATILNSLEAIGLDVTAPAKGCDTLGNCTEALYDTSAGRSIASRGIQVEILQNADPDINIRPHFPTLLNATVAQTLSGSISAPDLLQTLTISVNQTSLFSDSWMMGENISRTIFSAPWQPTTDGLYQFNIEAINWLNETVVYTTYIQVDTISPTVTLAKNVYTSSDYALLEFDLTGVVTDADQIYQVAVEIKNQADQTVFNRLATVDDGMWELIWPVAYQAANETYQVFITATDRAGWQTTLAQAVQVDVLPPDASEVTLTYGTGSVLEPTQAVRSDAAPNLRAGWTASNSADISSYTVDWLEELSDTLIVRQTSNHAAAGPLESIFTASDHQKLWVRLHSFDSHNNRNSGLIGPFYVDHQHTPMHSHINDDDQYMPLWIGESCNQLGTDYRISDRQPNFAALSVPQQFYGSWDEAGLHIGWRGANWNTSGDLFVYLDTQLGGTTRLYDPHGATVNNTHILLPNDMQADYLLWIKDDQTAQLLQWENGTLSQWVTVDEAVTMDYDGSRLLTTAYMPFADLSISNPDSNALSMVAVASEDDALRLWASLPAQNSLNSDQTVSNMSLDTLQAFMLTTAYTWPALGNNVCPADDHLTGGSTATAQLQTSLSASPTGVAYSLLGDNILRTHQHLLADGVDWATIWTDLCEDNPDDAACIRQATGPQTRQIDLHPARDLGHLKAVVHPVVSDGDEIVYTLEIFNRSTTASTPLTANFETWGPVTLSGGTTVATIDGESSTLTVVIPSIAVSETAILSVTGQIDLSFDVTHRDGWASVDVAVEDANGQIHDWFYFDHPIDTDAPSHIELTDPERLVPASLVTLSGQVADQADVMDVTIEVNSGGIQTVNCSNPTPDTGRWSCEVDFSGFSNGQTIQLRAKATDQFGQESDWYTLPTLTVDNTPPTLTVTSSSEERLNDGLVGPTDLVLQGEVNDNYLLDGVEVCITDEFGEICEQAEVTEISSNLFTQTTYVYLDEPETPLALSSATTCSPNNALVRSFTIDDSFTLADVDVSLDIEHGFRNDLQVVLTAPNGVQATIVNHTSGAANLIVTLDDSSATSVSLDEDTQIHPEQGVTRRPFPNSLNRFVGLNATGVWTLSICDNEPSNDDGQYIGATLAMRAQRHPVDSQTVWHHVLELPLDVDSINQTVKLYATDAVGNRSSTLGEYTHQMDTKGPDVTLDPYGLGVEEGDIVILSGDVSDTNTITDLTLTIYTPNKEVFETTIPYDGTEWRYDDGITTTYQVSATVFLDTSVPITEAVLMTQTVTLTETERRLFNQTGSYIFWISAEDEVENRTIIGSYSLTVFGPTTIYMPLISKNHSAPLNLPNDTYFPMMPSN
ncbi:MAG: LamG-like jellyroll fold domain-containing protein [Chloroflexota bacterium]